MMMPTYTFVNTHTDHQWDDVMSYDEKLAFLDDHPHVKSIITQVNIIGGHGSIKNDAGWNENMQRIAEAHPTSPHASKYGDKGGKAAKTREAVDKWRKKHQASK